MSEEQEFAELLQRVRDGDPAAAAALVQRYEPEIRRAVRIRLTDPRLRQVLDSTDICQSVLANFFIRVTAGQFQLERADDLLRLLMAMTRNKVLDKARRQSAECRDRRRTDTGASGVLRGVIDPAPGPSQIAAGKDLLGEVRRLLSDEERCLADQRARGRDWPEIAAELGGTPDGLRKKLTRALDRVARSLGLEEWDHA